MKTPEEIINEFGGEVREWSGTDLIAEFEDAGYVIVPKEPTEEMLDSFRDLELTASMCRALPVNFWTGYRTVIEVFTAKQKGQPPG